MTFVATLAIYGTASRNFILVSLWFGLGLLNLASALTSTSRFWPRPWPQPRAFDLCISVLITIRTMQMWVSETAHCNQRSTQHVQVTSSTGEWGDRHSSRVTCCGDSAWNSRALTLSSSVIVIPSMTFKCGLQCTSIERCSIRFATCVRKHHYSAHRPSGWMGNSALKLAFFRAPGA